MKKLIILTILLVGLSIQAKELPINEEYSFKAFPYHGLSFKNRPASEFNNTIIIGSCFYQEWREGDSDIVKDIFPDGMTGVIFRKSNLDNIYVPHGNIIENGTNKKIKVQNDWDDWELNKDLIPKEPLNKDIRLQTGVSIDPKDIPSKKFTKKQNQDFRKVIEGEMTIEEFKTLNPEAGFVSTPLVIGGGIGLILLALITIFFKKIKLWLKKYL